MKVYQEVVKELEPVVIKMFKDAAEEEMQWARLSFQRWFYAGLNADILKQSVMVLCNQRVRAI
jgi:ribonucleotide reductase beta subunit family protein with ferritin-like domain